MEFDGDTGRPTFRLVPGPPGGSEALALARRLGLPEDWLRRAEELLGDEHRDLRRLLEEVEVLRQELGSEARSWRRKSPMRNPFADASRRRSKPFGRSARSSQPSCGGSSRIFRLKPPGGFEKKSRRLGNSFARVRRKGLEGEAVQRLFEEAPSFSTGDEPGAEGPLVVGAPVRHRTLAWRGILEKLDGDRAEVSASGKRLRCRAGELVPATEEELPGSTKKARPRLSGAADLAAAAAAPAELNLIGQRVEPALGELDTFLDRALLAGVGQVRIVHGHGSGRLRSAVRKFLRAHRAVSSSRPGKAREGGDGATVVMLGSQ